jgi:hypothetical protein
MHFKKKLSHPLNPTPFQNLFVRVKGCKEMTFTVPEKNGSDLDDFSAAGVCSLSCKGKSSRDESFFPSRTVKVIFLRPLNYPLNVSKFQLTSTCFCTIKISYPL